MTPATAIAMLDRQLAAHGETITLTRLGTPDVTADVLGFVRRAVNDVLIPGNDPAQAQTVVTLSPTDSGTFDPVRGDHVTISGRETYIEQVEVVRMADEVVRYNLSVAG